MPFQPARRAALKGRVALCGPTGSGKTWTALGWARQLGSRVALIDTERRSASLYADVFDFETCAIDPPYHPQRLTAALKEAQGYDVVVVDSLSHFWAGQGGVLEIVDKAAEKVRGNTYVAWGEGTREQHAMVEALLAVDCHLIATMRSKMDHAQEKDERGKTVVRRLGMAPVQRNDIEYEFTLVGELDQQHNLKIAKSRCSSLADREFAPGQQEQAAKEFLAWLDDGIDLTPILNGLRSLENDDERLTAKEAFVTRFGKPADLSAERVAEATAWVESRGWLADEETASA